MDTGEGLLGFAIQTPLSKLMFVHTLSTLDSQPLPEPPDLKCIFHVDGWGTGTANPAENSEFHKANGSGMGNILDNI